MDPKDIIQGLLQAVKDAEDFGCIVYLDCWDDAKVKWYIPIENAKKFLKLC